VFLKSSGVKQTSRRKKTVVALVVPLLFQRANMGRKTLVF